MKIDVTKPVPFVGETMQTTIDFTTITGNKIKIDVHHIPLSGEYFIAIPYLSSIYTITKNKKNFLSSQTLIRRAKGLAKWNVEIPLLKINTAMHGSKEGKSTNQTCVNYKDFHLLFGSVPDEEKRTSSYDSDMKRLFHVISEVPTMTDDSSVINVPLSGKNIASGKTVVCVFQSGEYEYLLAKDLIGTKAYEIYHEDDTPAPEAPPEHEASVIEDADVSIENDTSFKPSAIQSLVVASYNSVFKDEESVIWSLVNMKELQLHVSAGSEVEKLRAVIASQQKTINDMLSFENKN